MAKVAYTVVGFYMSYDDAPLWWRDYMDDTVNGEVERAAEARLYEFDENIFWLDDVKRTFVVGYWIDRVYDSDDTQPYEYRIDDYVEDIEDAEGKAAEIYEDLIGREPNRRPQVMMVMMDK